MSRSDRIALIFSLLAVLGAFLVHDQVFERMAHLEDEMAYVWEAEVIARGHLTLPTPPHPKSFLVPFVVDYQGQRFGKYPLGWPLLLAVGVRFGLRFLVNPLLAGVGVWLTYRLGKHIFSEVVGLLAAGLTLTSPFFLMNSGSLLSHPLGLALSAGFALSWLNAFGNKRASKTWLNASLAGVSLGFLAITRPLTAIGVGLPFAVHGIILLIRGNKETRLQLFALGGIAITLGSIQLLWQYIATGDPFYNLYTLWWEYDKVGFGKGYGVLQEGHSLHQAIKNTRQTLERGFPDIFGWWKLSWIFLPFGLVAIIKNRARQIDATLISSVFPVLVLIYMAYWIGAFLFGPRYYYEGLYSLTILSAAGIAWLGELPYRPGEHWVAKKGWNRVRTIGVFILLIGLVGYNLFFYTPPRLAGMYGLYGVSRSHMEPFMTEEALANSPALVIVHPQDKWVEYGTLVELSSPFLDSPFIFVYSRGPRVDQQLAKSFPERNVFHYYPDEPYKLYVKPRQ